LTPRDPDCPIPGSLGCVGAVGPRDAPILLLGEAAGHYEAYRGVPFVSDAPAGSQLDRLLGWAGIRREECRFANVVRCHPPKDYLVGAPWEEKALAHCAPALHAVLAEPHAVVVPLGASALRAVMNFGPRRKGRKDNVRVEDFHGAPTRSQLTSARVVPTFHPAFLQYGAWKFTKTCVFDLSVAKEVASGKWEADEPTLVIDPPYAWFAAWASRYLAEMRADPERVLLAVDTETKDKTAKSDEGELGREDQSWEILYVNLSFDAGEGVTVPWVSPYREKVKEILEAGGILLFWNAPYDVPRFKRAGVDVKWENVRDVMDAWHALQSDLPRGLGFVAPHYSRVGPWKHLGNLNGTYRALDGVQTLRCAFGVLADLEAEGMGRVFERHMWALDTYALRPAEDMGLPINQERHEAWISWVGGVVQDYDARIAGVVPEELRPMDGPYAKQVEGWTHEKEEDRLVQVCERCQEQEVSKKHRCADLRSAKSRAAAADSALVRVVLAERRVTRYYRQLLFNAGSWQQVLAYIRAKGHKPGKNKKKGTDSTDKKTIDRLAKTTKDPFYIFLRERRQAQKMEGTYGTGLRALLGPDRRLHSTFTHVPSTLRLSSVKPNLQNLGHHVKYAPEFRRCVEAAEGCQLLTFDYAAIEAVLTGWFCRDPEFIRLAKLGIHANLTGILCGNPAEAAWSAGEKLAHFRMLKQKYEREYDMAKRCVYLTLYGGTETTMADQYPETFPSRKEAARIQGLLFQMLPSLPRWHAAVRRIADQRKQLGGPVHGRTAEEIIESVARGAHPFGYKHHFYNVVAWRKQLGKWKESLGTDGKRVVAFPPQSTAFGIMAEAVLRLFMPGESIPGESPGNYIGDAYYGATPLRALIHDELVLEVPEPQVERVYASVMAEMGRPIVELPCLPAWGLGEHLSIGVAAKIGRNWAAFNDDPARGSINLEGMKSVTSEQDIAADEFWMEEEDDEAA
jgi:uracil-DNA glycosylase family 4